MENQLGRPKVKEKKVRKDLMILPSMYDQVVLSGNIDNITLSQYVCSLINHDLKK